MIQAILKFSTAENSYFIPSEHAVAVIGQKRVLGDRDCHKSGIIFLTFALEDDGFKVPYISGTIFNGDLNPVPSRFAL